MKSIKILSTALILTVSCSFSAFQVKAERPVPGVLFSKEIHFGFDRSDLSPEAKLAVQAIAEEFQKISGNRKIMVSAHTDAVGSNQYNLTLSRKRANQVKKALIRLKIPADLVQTEFFGEGQPLASNDLASGRQQNRRATISILSEKMLGTTSPVPVDSNVAVVTLPGKVKDEKTGKGIAATVIFNVGNKRDSIKTDSEGNYSIQVPVGSTVTTEVKAQDYFFKPETITATPESAKTKIETKLTPAEEGEKIALTNIHFEPDQTVLMEGSSAALESLLRFMRENPKVRVEIGGHVSKTLDDWGGMTQELWDLSTNRAKFIYDNLVENGISKERLSYKGYGNTQMLFPYGKTDEEFKANRRVEVKILGKN